MAGRTFDIRIAGFLALLLVGCVGSPVQQAGFEQTDRGIGGTGIGIDTVDRGIGGTGIVGTLTGFGSIWVNGLRIAVPDTTVLTIDGQPATDTILARGQTVSVLVADAPRGTVVATPIWSAERIDVWHAVIGPVETADVQTQMLRVLGQSVVVPAGVQPPAPGTWVAVSGLRRTDGVIVATRLASATPGQWRLRGLVDGVAPGRLSIGALTLDWPAISDTVDGGPTLGQWVEGVGDFVHGRPVASAVTPVRLPAPGLTRLVLEAFVGPGGQLVSAASGVDVVLTGVAAGTRFVVDLRLDPNDDDERGQIVGAVPAESVPQGRPDRAAGSTPGPAPKSGLAHGGPGVRSDRRSQRDGDRGGRERGDRDGGEGRR